MANEAYTDEQVLTEEEQKEQDKAVMRMNEDDILRSLLDAASYKTSEDEFVNIEIARNGKLLFTFRIRPMSEEEFMQCRRDNTVYKKNKQSGVRMADHVDGSRYRSQLIYEATVEEDRDKLWDNRRAWGQMSVLNGIDMIDVVLKAGEKDAIISTLENISGYNLDAEETAKN